MPSIVDGWNVWLGGWRDTETQPWSWTDRTELNYSNCGEGYPDTDCENCNYVLGYDCDDIVEDKWCVGHDDY